MIVNRYYDVTDDKQYTTDDEGNLVMLCREHAAQLQARDEVEWAGRGDEYSACEFGDCEAANDPAWHASLRRLA
jgi:phosphoglucomutase